MIVAGDRPAALEISAPAEYGSAKSTVTHASWARRIGVGSLWSLIGYAGSQGTRLVANLVLARLLFPEAFGLMLIVGAVVHGLQMFSDLGTGPSVLQHRNGDDESFLRTAWTIQVARGAALTATAIALAWPLAQVYGQPVLVWCIPVAGLSAVIAGASSIQILRLNRHIRLSRVVMLETTSQIVAAGIAIIWAAMAPSIWPLVALPVIAALLRSAGSHIVLPPFRHRLEWNGTAARSIMKFGKWIFLSSILGFVAGRGHQLIVAHGLPEAMGGSYFMAFLVTGGVIFGLHALSSQVMLPAIARMREESPAELAGRIRKLRAGLMALTMAPLAMLTLFGDPLMGLLLDERYADAGWIVRILAGGGMAACVIITAGACLLPLGDSRGFTVWLALQAIMMILGMMIGHALAGDVGLVYGVAAAPLLSYPALVWALRRHDLWQRGLDIAGLLACGVIVGAAFVI